MQPGWFAASEMIFFIAVSASLIKSNILNKSSTAISPSPVFEFYYDLLLQFLILFM